MPRLGLRGRKRKCWGGKILLLDDDGTSSSIPRPRSLVKRSNRVYTNSTHHPLKKLELKWCASYFKGHVWLTHVVNVLDIANLIIGQCLNPVLGSKKLGSLRKMKIQKVRILFGVMRRQDNIFDMAWEPVYVEG